MVNEAKEYRVVKLDATQEAKQNEYIDLIAKYQKNIPSKDTKVVLPLQNFAKELLKTDVKYAHNSIYNPIYPKPKAEDYWHKVRFTVVGNRVTREFIYCCQLVSGLYKYRPKIFKPPNITGVTGVEWPEMSRLIKLRYGGLAYCTEGQVAVIIEDSFVGGVDELKALIERKFIYYLCPDYYNLSVEEFRKFVSAPKRPSAYMHISIAGKHSGTFIFMLYADLVPQTCENFLRLCCLGRGGYRGTPIHRIVKEGWVQGGGFGLKETDLRCENFIVHHDRRGVLCMANDGRNKDCSTQFFILLHPAPWMDDKYVAFGQLIDGGKLLDTIEEVPTYYEAPLSEIKIMDAGVFNMECHGIHVSKDTREFIQLHVEDLNDLGKWVYNLLFDKVWLAIKTKKKVKSPPSVASFGEGEDLIETDDDTHTHSSDPKKEDPKKEVPADKAEEEKKEQLEEQWLNNWQPEEYAYPQISHVSEVELPVVPFYIPLTDVPYPDEVSSEYDLKKFLRGDYCLEADITVGVNLNLLRYHRSKTNYGSQMVMKGEEEEENEIINEEESREKKKPLSVKRFKFDSRQVIDDDSKHLKHDVRQIDDEYKDYKDVDYAEDEEIQDYIRKFGDHVSFAGMTVKNIARTQDDTISIGPERKSFGSISEDQGFSLTESIRWPRIKQTSYLPPWKFSDYEEPDEDDLDHVHVISFEPTIRGHTKTRIQRRQTGLPSGFTKFPFPRYNEDGGDDDDDNGDKDEEDDDEDDDYVPIDWSMQDISPYTDEHRRSSARAVYASSKREETRRNSGLDRLYDIIEKTSDQEFGALPTLQNYKPMTSDVIRKNLLLTRSSSSRQLRGDADTPKSKFIIHTQTKPESFENILSMYVDNKLARRYSSDYLQVLDQIEHREEASIRCVEYAKKRPFLSVKEYQEKNQQAVNIRATSAKPVPRPQSHKAATKTK